MEPLNHMYPQSLSSWISFIGPLIVPLAVNQPQGSKPIRRRADVDQMELAIIGMSGEIWTSEVGPV